MTIKESIEVDPVDMKISCRNGVNIKGARKVLQDYLKEHTNIKGYWTLYYLKDDGERYHFIVDHPMMRMMP